MLKAPQVNLIYFKALLDACFLKFIDLFSNDFEQQNRQYVLCTPFGKQKLQKIFMELLADELKAIVSPSFSLLHPTYYLVIGACYPKSNLLLSQKGAHYFPQKLLKAIEEQPNARYMLHDKSVHVDMKLFNDVFDGILQQLFKKQEDVNKLLGLKHPNVFFVQHSKLDCYTMFKTLKSIYGRSNCCNLYEKMYGSMNAPLVAMNDLIDRYVKSKAAVTSTDEFKKIAVEVKQFVDTKMRDAQEPRNG